MTTKIGDIIRRVPQWRGAEDFQVEELQGLTNANYVVTLEGERYAVRVSGDNTARLGIKRENEIEALTAAAAAGIAPELIAFIQPEGHLVTRFIEGHHPSLEEYRRPENLSRVIETVKRLHQLPPH